MLNLSFTDGTKATVLAGDMILGGVRNLIETYATAYQAAEEGRRITL